MLLSSTARSTPHEGQTFPSSKNTPGIQTSLRRKPTIRNWHNLKSPDPRDQEVTKAGEGGELHFLRRLVLEKTTGVGGDHDALIEMIQPPTKKNGEVSS